MSSKLQEDSHNLSDVYVDENELEEKELNDSNPSRQANVRGKSPQSKSRPLSTETFSPSKKTKLDDMFESKSTIASESTNDDQEEKQKSESVLTKTFRGQ